MLDKRIGMATALPLILGFMPWMPAAAQGPGGEAEAGDIVVTARQRAERLIDVPVAITAFAAEDIDRFGSRSLQDLAVQTPQLIVNQEVGATAGSITLRGVSTGTFGLDLDQAVSLNVDGVVLSRVATLQQGFFDVEQVEVLKGPQALFFGKNSPGGIISFRTADPGDALEMLARASYEVTGRRVIGEAVVSGPLGETIGARLAVQYRNQRGYFRNQLAGQSLNRVPRFEDVFGRLTLAGDLTDRLSIRAKLALGRQDSSGGFSSFQTYFCPSTPAPRDDCRPNRRTRAVDAPAFLANALDVNKDGRPSQDLESVLGSIELNYDTGAFMLTSVTGLNSFDREFVSVDPMSVTAFDPTITAVLSGNATDYRSITQELRLASQLGGPFEMMVGFFYQDVRNRSTPSGTFAISPTVAAYQLAHFRVDTTAYSAFGQLSYDLLPVLNLSAGVRYTREEKTADKTRVVSGGGAPFVIPLYRGAERDAEDVSPEVAISFRPTEQINIYASYKEGFKSGGFASTFSGAQVRSFRPEHVDGFEIGAKVELLDRQLRLNLAAYRYQYDDLQVTSFDPTTLSNETLNAAGARVKGVEASLQWQPRALPGFGLNAAFGYNKAYYTDFRTGCWVGQTVALGCTLDPTVAGVFRSQNLAGRPLPNAPRWSGNVDASHEGGLADGWRYGLAVGAAYTGRYQGHDKGNPAGFQDKSVQLNASVRLMSEDRRWELALIGRNLTNIYRASFVQEIIGTGSGTGTATGRSANLAGFYGEPRTIAFQATVRFGPD